MAAFLSFVVGSSGSYLWDDNTCEFLRADVEAQSQVPNNSASTIWYNYGVALNENYNRKDYVADPQECVVEDSSSTTTTTSTTVNSDVSSNKKNASSSLTEGWDWSCNTTTTTTTTTTTNTKKTYKGQKVTCKKVSDGEGDYAHCSDVPTRDCP